MVTPKEMYKYYLKVMLRLNVNHSRDPPLWKK